MFPRTALVILALLVAMFIATFIRLAFVAQETRSFVTCNRDIAEPYQQLLARMRELADAGKMEQLRLLIARAQERSADLSRVCSERDGDLYAAQVRELIK